MPAPLLRRLALCCVIANALTGPVRGQNPPTPPGTEPTLPPIIVRPPETAPATTPTYTAPAVPNFVPFDAFSSPSRAQSLLGTAGSASQGQFGRYDLQTRPILRPGEVLESVPGLIVTQHSGSGKANQYFLRGFNLDHGTDFAVSMDGVPLNQRTHGHGQGYLDLNFLIPELIDHVDYRKGTYFAQDGDFASAGAADIYLSRNLPQSYVKFGGGMYDFWRLLTVDSSQVGRGTLFTAFEYQTYNGPWVLPEDGQKFNGVMKYSVGDDESGAAVSLLGYSNTWNSTDQIPLRAVEDGSIPRLGFVDGTDGGGTRRIGGNVQWWRRDDYSQTTANFYSTFYRLNLFSNFTYFLDDPVNGDQFEQFDERVTTGFNLRHDWQAAWFKNTAGFQVRNDAIGEVGLYDTVARNRINTISNSEVDETSYSLYWQQQLTVLPKVRPFYGLRGDYFTFDVDSRNLPINSGSTDAGIFSPKAGIAFGPWAETEFFLNWGLGFHSNDARGTVLQVDPVTLTPVQQSNPLVRSQGYEAGLRSQAIQNLTTTITAWTLELDSELLFVGDAGTTEASRPSRRTGVEWTNYYRLQNWLTWDADAAWTHARFTDEDPAGDFIPGAVGTVVSTGPTVRLPSGWYWGLRSRYFGSRPLIEDDSIRSPYTSLFNMSLGYLGPRVRTSVDFLNLFDSGDRDIDYYYTSRLPGEPAGGIDDHHFHPVEPFNVRFNFALMY